MPAKKRAKKDAETPKTEEVEESELPEVEETVRKAEAEPRQLSRDELEALRRRLQEKFH